MPGYGKPAELGLVREPSHELRDVSIGEPGDFRGDAIGGGAGIRVRLRGSRRGSPQKQGRQQRNRAGCPQRLAHVSR